MVFVVSPVHTRHCGKRQTGWFGMRLMRPTGATCLLLFQWFTTWKVFV